jgi:hypothetical protein
MRATMALLGIKLHFRNRLAFPIAMGNGVAEITCLVTADTLLPSVVARLYFRRRQA